MKNIKNIKSKNGLNYSLVYFQSINLKFFFLLKLNCKSPGIFFTKLLSSSFIYESFQLDFHHHKRIIKSEIPPAYFLNKKV